MKSSKGKRCGRWTLTLFSAGILLQTTEDGCRQQVEATLFTGMESYATTLVSSFFTAATTLIARLSGLKTPARSVMSLKVPSLLLRNSKSGSPP